MLSDQNVKRPLTADVGREETQHRSQGPYKEGKASEPLPFSNQARLHVASGVRAWERLGQQAG